MCQNIAQKPEKITRNAMNRKSRNTFIMSART
jgi:hypothetical protein